MIWQCNAKPTWSRIIKITGWLGPFLPQIDLRGRKEFFKLDKLNFCGNYCLHLRYL